MNRLMLTVTNDAVSKRLLSEYMPIGVPVSVTASSEANTVTTIWFWAAEEVNCAPLNSVDWMVHSAICALAATEHSALTINQIMIQMGHSCPSSKTAQKLRRRIETSVLKLASAEIELSAADGINQKTKKRCPWLSDISRMALVRCDIVKDAGTIKLVKLRPLVPDNLTTALPLLMRAYESGQVINIYRDTWPPMRMTFGMRVMTLELIVRAKQSLPNKKVLLEKLFRNAGYSFSRSDAGRHVRARAIGALTRILDFLVEQTNIINDYCFELEDGGRRKRLVELYVSEVESSDEKKSES